MYEHTLKRRMLALDHCRPAFVHWRLSDPGAQPPNSVELGLWCRVHDQDIRAHTENLCCERDPLRRIARADRPDASRAILRLQQRDCIECAADLERTNRLQGLKLEINFTGHIVRIEPHQRRTNSGSIDSFTCRPNCLERDSAFELRDIGSEGCHILEVGDCITTPRLCLSEWFFQRRALRRE